MDVNDNGGVSLDEFEMAVVDPNMRSILAGLKLDVNDLLTAG